MDFGSGRDIYVSLKLPDLMAKGGLRNEDPLRRACEIQGLGGCLDVTKKAECKGI